MTSQFNTISYQAGDNVAVNAIILPSSAETYSPGACHVVPETGVMHASSKPRYLKASTLLEMNNAPFRKMANANKEFIAQLDDEPGTMFGLEHAFSEWMRYNQAQHLRLFLGGDFANGNQLRCALNAAASNPEKKIYIRTCLQSELNNMWIDSAANDYPLIPDNVLLFVEPGYDELDLAGLPRVNFVENDGATPQDMEFFPSSREDITIALPEDYRTVLNQKGPWWSKPFKKSDTNANDTDDPEC